MIEFLKKQFGFSNELGIIAYYFDFIFIPLLIAALAISAAPTIPGIAFGIIAWTLIEYGVHRFVFHHMPFAKTAHEVHHAHPSGMTGLSSWYTVMTYGGAALLIPGGILAGILIGYLAYITIHHAVHHWVITSTSPLYGMKMRHVMHHRGVEANFGVTSTLWDHVFQTHVPWKGRA